MLKSRFELLGTARPCHAAALLVLGDTKLSRLGETLCDNLEVLFEDVKGSIRPSVLHGDLWSGNIASVGGQPAIFDPAVYYGHSEAEFGMSWCAGGWLPEHVAAGVCGGGGRGSLAWWHTAAAACMVICTTLQQYSLGAWQLLLCTCPFPECHSSPDHPCACLP
jgi:hypothetical protein